MKTKITKKKVLDCLDKEYELIYIGYEENFQNNANEIQDAIHSQSYEPIYEITDYINYDDDTISFCLTRLESELVNKFDISNETAKQIIEKYHDEIVDEILSRDVSTPTQDLFRNTKNFVCFYDTGYYIYGETWCMTKQESTKELKEIKKVLGIKIKDTTYDNQLTEMILQASYGGRLVVYFSEDAQKLIEIGDKNTITFKNPVVAIIDTYNGCGDHTILTNHQFSLPLDVKNIFLDKTIKYNYTYRVCGMDDYWCNDTIETFSKRKTKQKIKKSTISDEIEKEKKYKDVYKNGGCSFSDNDITRHRDVYYDNNYPCGFRCPHCGRFWID